MSDGLKRNGESRHRYRLAQRVPGRGGIGASHPGGHVDELAAAYALGALEPSEREHVERHCRVCPACASLVAEDTRTVGLLPLAVVPARPAPDVKVALFARIAHAQRAAAEVDLPTRSLPPTLTIPASRPTAIPVGPAPAAEIPVRPIGPWRRRGGSSRLGWATTFLSVPLLLALAVTGIWGMQLREQVSSQGAQVSQLKAHLASFAAGAVQYPLAPNPGSAAPQAEGSIILGANQREGMLLVDLNRPGPKGTYQLMVVKDGKLVPAADVEVNDQGEGETLFTLDRPFDEYQSVQVQAKPLESGAPAPAAGESILSGDIGGSIGSPGSGANNALP